MTNVCCCRWWKNTTPAERQARKVTVGPSDIVLLPSVNNFINNRRITSLDIVKNMVYCWAKIAAKCQDVQQGLHGRCTWELLSPRLALKQMQKSPRTWKNYLLTSSPLCILVIKFNVQPLAKYPKINNTGINGNYTAKCIDHQISANTLVFKLK